MQELKLDAKITAWIVARQLEIEGVLRQVLLSKWMLFFSFFCIMQWHVLPLFPGIRRDVPQEKRSFVGDLRAWFMDRADRGNDKAFTIGQNILVLQFFFAPHLQEITLGAPFLFSVFSILYNQYFLYRVRNRLAACAGINLLSDKEITEVTSEYMDLSGDVSKVLYLGVVQFFLMLYYVKALFETLSPDGNLPDFGKVNCGTWALGVLVILVAGDETGRPFDLGKWDYIELSYRWIIRDWSTDPPGDGSNWREERYKPWRTTAGGEKLSTHAEISSRMRRHRYRRSVLFTKEMQEVWFRRMPDVLSIPARWYFKFQARKYMDFSINSLSRLILLSTGPILLSMSEEMEFLKDCTAIFFIAKLDDLNPPIMVDAMIDNFVEKYKPADK